MQVILTKDVSRLGKAGELKKVADGYARNYLLPRGMAVMATDGAIKEATARVEERKRQDAREKAAAQSRAEQLDGIELTFTAKVGENDRLYGSITSADIAEKLGAQLGEEVDRRKIVLGEPLKELGKFKVPVRLHSDVSITVTVILVAEE